MGIINQNIINMITKNGHKYSSVEFDDYLFRAVLHIVADSISSQKFEIYTTDFNKDNVILIVSENIKIPTVVSIAHWATRDEDDYITNFINTI